MKNRAAEADRRFCRHSMVHFLDVARIGTIIALEEGLKINREWIYAAALLHDCGKHEQYLCFKNYRKRSKTQGGNRTD